MVLILFAGLCLLEVEEPLAQEEALSPLMNESDYGLQRVDALQIEKRSSGSHETDIATNSRSGTVGLKAHSDVAALIISGLALLVSLAAYLEGRSARKTSNLASAKRDLDEAWDTLGGGANTTELTTFSAGPESLEKADRLISQAELKAPRYWRTRYLRGFYYLAKKRRAKAMSLLREAEALAPMDPSIKMSIGNLLVSDGKADEGIAYLNQARKIDPGNTSVLSALSIALWGTGNRKGAIAFLQHAVLLEPNYAGGHYRLGTYLLMEKHNTEAYKHLLQATRIDPRLAHAHLSLAQALDALSKTAEGVEHARIAVTLEPENVDFLVGLGELLESLNELKSAEESYLKAKRIDPRRRAPYEALDRIYRTMGRVEDAQAVLRESYDFT